MVAAVVNETIFSVLGEVARARRRHVLVFQCVAGLVPGALLVVSAAAWWPASALLAAVAAHGLWGLTVSAVEEGRGSHTRIVRLVARLIAVLGVAFAMSGMIGVGVAMFTGHGRSPYNPCGPGATSAYCRAQAHPPTRSAVP